MIKYILAISILSQYGEYAVKQDPYVSFQYETKKDCEEDARDVQLRINSYLNGYRITGAVLVKCFPFTIENDD